MCGLKLYLHKISFLTAKSHPVWVCGLKPLRKRLKSWSSCHTLYGCVDWNLYIGLCYGQPQSVTPCMGVWIETSDPLHYWLGCLVTPCMGVWIETIKNLPRICRMMVTPCMGVWIETQLLGTIGNTLQSHPVWVCGLKQTRRSCNNISFSHTLYGCVDWNCKAK